jgi:hypothetical protein
MYVVKSSVNLLRQKHGYNEGTYIKKWSKIGLDYDHLADDDELSMGIADDDYIALCLYNDIPPVDFDLDKFYTQLVAYYTNYVAAHVADEAWREFSGTQSLTNGQFKDAVDTFVAKRLQGRFAGLFIVKPETIITDEDEQRGYSWRLVIHLYADSTAMIH